MTDTREATPRPIEARERLARAIQERELDWILWGVIPENGATKKYFRSVAEAALKALHLTDAAALALMDDEGMVAPKWLTLGQHDAAKHLNDRVKFYQAAIAASPYKENPND